MKRKILTISLILLCVLTSVVFSTACSSRCVVGNCAVTSDAFRLDIDRMTGTNKFTMELTAGDTLEIQFTAAKGSMQMEIKEPDGDTLYAGNGKGVSDFTVNIFKSGVYSIVVEAYYAKGSVHIQQMDGTKIQGSR